MKGQLIAFLIVFVIIFSMFPAVRMGGASLNNSTKIGRKHLDLTFAPPEVVKLGDYDWLKMPDCSYISMPGHPMLPIKSMVEKLPLNSHITQVIAEVENVSLEENYFIMPALTPVEAGSTEPLNTSSPDPAIYGKDELYPNEWHVYRVGNGLDPDSNRRVQYVSFYFYPLRYLPTEQKILLAQHVSLTITYTEPAEEPTAQTVLKNLIITSDTLEPYAVQLAAYKNSTDISSRAVNLTWVYKNYGGIDHQEQIRNCIKGFVASYGITYVTIFGDADQVPVRYAFVNDTQTGETYVPTDLYYGDLDGTWDDNNDGIYGDQKYDNVDGIPDVYVGRIPPSLASYAQTAVDKIIGYQQQFNASESWTRRVVLAAGTGSGDGFSNPFGIAFPFLKNYTANINVNKNIVKMYEAYGNLSTGSMGSEINKGALFVNFAGHGDPGMWLFYWVIPGLWWNGYGIADVQGLTNGFKLPVVTTMACSTARFDDQDCIGEWFVLQPNGGSIAYFGSTRIAYGYDNQWITTGLMGEIDWRIYQNFYEGWTRLGQMWGQTTKEYVQSHIWNYKYASVYDVKTLMEFILLGDPTLRIYNPNYPETLRVPEDCPTIQSAINAAYDGDSILVSSGIYYENLIINKSVSIIGQNPINTIIDGKQAGSVINITANDVLISTFTIRNSSQNWPCSGIYITNCSRAFIQNNNITDNLGFGIYFDGTGSYGGNNNITINSNEITNNFFGGILISGSHNNNITLNTIEDNGPNNQWAGIYLVNSTNNTVNANRLTNNWCGIRLVRCQNSTIISNNIRANPYGGIYLEVTVNNSIYHNSFVDNTPQVVFSYGSNNVNTWDNGYPSGGNYWSDYVGVDVKKGPNQDQPGSDNIGDTPYIFYANDVDHYPLMNPYGSLPPPTYSLTITATAGGITNPIPGTDTYSQGQNVPVQASPSIGYVFDYWELDGLNVGSTNPYTVLMDNDHALHAVFVQINYYTLTITTTAGGTTNPSPEVYTYAGGSNVQITAIPDINYTLDHWELDGVNRTENPINVIMDQDYTLHAVFVIHDVAVTDVTPSKTVVGQGYDMNINVTVANRGDSTETFNVTGYANQTIGVGFQNITLSSGNSTTITSLWNTTGFGYGDYTLRGCAWPVNGEMNTANNNCTCNIPVHIGVPGDVSSSAQGVYDKKCDMKDIAYMIILFNTKPSSVNWNPNADVDNNGVVNMRDIAIAILNFNQHE